MPDRHCILHGCALCFCRRAPADPSPEETRRHAAALISAMEEAGLRRGQFRIANTGRPVDVTFVEAPSRDFPRPT